ncbi:MAG: alkaline phosphatase, partial [Spirochaetota bacterium]
MSVHKIIAVFFFAVLISCCGESSKEKNHYIILFIGDGMHLENEIAASRYLTGGDRALSFHSFEFSGDVATWDITAYNRYSFSAYSGYYPFSYNAFAKNPSRYSRAGYDISKGGAQSYPLSDAASESYFTAPLKYSASSSAAVPATDSAAAATAIATGYKTESGNISWRAGDAAGGTLITIAEKLKLGKGYAVGIISTVPFNHATPAAFISHAADRSNYHTIASDIIHSSIPDLIIGGGHPRWNTAETYLSAYLYRELKNSAYYMAERTAGSDGGAILSQGAAAAAARNRRFFALFGGSDGAFDPPSVVSTGTGELVSGSAENPSLSRCVETAAEFLSDRGGGFFIMAEQGDIDWRNHDHDYAGATAAVISLDNAVRTAVTYKRPGNVNVTYPRA